MSSSDYDYRQLIDNATLSALDSVREQFIYLDLMKPRRVKQLLGELLDAVTDFNMRNNNRVFPLRHAEILKICNDFKRSRLEITYMGEDFVAAEVVLNELGQSTSIVVEKLPKAESIVRFMTQNK